MQIRSAAARWWWQDRRGSGLRSLSYAHKKRNLIRSVKLSLRINRWLDYYKVYQASISQQKDCCMSRKSLNQSKMLICSRSWAGSVARRYSIWKANWLRSCKIVEWIQRCKGERGVRWRLGCSILQDVMFYLSGDLKLTGMVHRLGFLQCQHATIAKSALIWPDITLITQRHLQTVRN